MKTARNYLAGLSTSVWSAVLSLAVVPFYLKYLGVEAYGLVNRQIVATDTNGFLAATSDARFDALHALRSDASRARRMGESGRELVEAQYSMQAIAPRLEAILRAP